MLVLFDLYSGYNALHFKRIEMRLNETFEGINLYSLVYIAISLVRFSLNYIEFNFFNGQFSFKSLLFGTWQCLYCFVYQIMMEISPMAGRGGAEEIFLNGDKLFNLLRQIDFYLLNKKYK